MSLNGYIKETLEFSSKYARYLPAAKDISVSKAVFTGSAIVVLGFAIASSLFGSPKDDDDTSEDREHNHKGRKSKK